MINTDIVNHINQIIPKGKRSNFVNQALKEALEKFSRETAYKNIREFAEKSNFSMTVKEINAAKNKSHFHIHPYFSNYKHFPTITSPTLSPSTADDTIPPA